MVALGIAGGQLRGERVDLGLGLLHPDTLFEAPQDDDEPLFTLRLRPAHLERRDEIHLIAEEAEVFR